MTLGAGKYDKYLDPVVEDVPSCAIAILVVLTEDTETCGLSMKVGAPVHPMMAKNFRPMMKDLLEEMAQSVDQVARISHN